MPSDIEIARAARKLPMPEIAARLSIPAEALVPYGHDKAKIDRNFTDAARARPRGRVVMGAPKTPTPAGRGHTPTPRGG
ncbi:MAG: formate--tetrahydrofolate ligase, partial [Rhodobacteraceae bacterium]|nr:formate--tetrahydrofolate ligase [Paracoccaceae bacterium]